MLLSHARCTVHRVPLNACLPVASSLKRRGLTWAVVLACSRHGVFMSVPRHDCDLLNTISRSVWVRVGAYGLDDRPSAGAERVCICLGCCADPFHSKTADRKSRHCDC